MAKTDDTATPEPAPDTGLENPPTSEAAAPVVAAPVVQAAPVSQPVEVNEDADETVPGGRYKDGDRLVNANGEPIE